MPMPIPRAMCTAMKMPPEEIFEHKQETTTPAREVMEHLYQAIVAAPEFTLKDGTRAKTELLGAPELDSEGELYFSFDVALDNGSHVEFTVRNTGWGRSIMAERSVKKGRNR